MPTTLSDRVEMRPVGSVFRFFCARSVDDPDAWRQAVESAVKAERGADNGLGSVDSTDAPPMRKEMPQSDQPILPTQRINDMRARHRLILSFCIEVHVCQTQSMGEKLDGVTGNSRFDLETQQSAAVIAVMGNSHAYCRETSKGIVYCSVIVVDVQDELQIFLAGCQLSFEGGTVPTSGLLAEGSHGSREGLVQSIERTVGKRWRRARAVLVEEGLVKLAAVAKRVVAGLGDCGPFPQGSGSTSSQLLRSDSIVDLIVDELLDVGS
ncbi:MAG: hypothetical protein TREMPRED_001000, partial [Tremellales sp. Tagirdzhanova-0007]